MFYFSQINSFLGYYASAGSKRYFLKLLSFENHTFRTLESITQPLIIRSRIGLTLPLLMIIIFAIQRLMAQEITTVKPYPAISIELGGPGGYASMNFEKPFLQYKNTSFTIRAGFSTFHLRDYQNKFNPDLIVPLSIRAYTGKNHQLEIGAGQVITSIVVADAEENKKMRNLNLHSQLALGYRYAPEGKRWMAAISYSPIIDRSHGYRHWAALSFSYILNRNKFSKRYSFRLRYTGAHRYAKSKGKVINFSRNDA